LAGPLELPEDTYEVAITAEDGDLAVTLLRPEYSQLAATSRVLRAEDY
jgi:hypothetical protein